MQARRANASVNNTSQREKALGAYVDFAKGCDGYGDFLIKLGIFDADGNQLIKSTKAVEELVAEKFRDEQNDLADMVPLIHSWEGLGENLNHVVLDQLVRLAEFRRDRISNPTILEEDPAALKKNYFNNENFTRTDIEEIKSAVGEFYQSFSEKAKKLVELERESGEDGTILMLFTGGTIGGRQAEMFESYNNGSLPIVQFMRSLNIAFNAKHLSDLDSREITLGHLISFAENICVAMLRYDQIAMTHGSITASNTGVFLSHVLGPIMAEDPNKKIVLLGSKNPYGAEESDASFRIGCALTMLLSEGFPKNSLGARINLAWGLRPMDPIGTRKNIGLDEIVAVRRGNASLDF